MIILQNPSIENLGQPEDNGELSFSGDGKLACVTQLHGPSSMAVSSAGILYFTDTLNHRIRNVDFSTDLISTVGGMHRRGTWHLMNEAEYNDKHGTRWIDVTVRHPAAGGQPSLRNGGTRDGEAPRRGELEKHARYSGNNLLPFVVEPSGRIRA